MHTSASSFRLQELLSLRERNVELGEIKLNDDCGAMVFGMLEGHTFLVYCSTNQLFVAPFDCNALQMGEPRVSEPDKERHPKNVHKLDVSDDGRFVASVCEGGQIRVWEVQRSGEEMVSDVRVCTGICAQYVHVHARSVCHMRTL